MKKRSEHTSQSGPKRQWSYLAITLLVLLNSPVKATDCPPPSWYESEDSLKKPGYHVAIGSGVSLEDAKNEATASLAKTISTEISSQTTLKNKIIEQSGQHHSQEELVEAINIASQMTLRGIKPTKSVKVCDIFYVAVSISQAEAEKQLSRQDKFMENIKLALEGKLKALDKNLSSVITNVEKLETKSSEIEKNTQSLVEASDEMKGIVEILQKRLKALEESKGVNNQLDGPEQLALDFQEECSRGVGQSCGFLGYIFKEGNGKPKSLSSAKTYYTKACELNDGYGCYGLGIFYEMGQTVKPSLQEAIKLFSKSCDLNWGQACWKLGITFHLHPNLSNEKQNQPNLVGKLYSKACDLNEGMGCFSLAGLYEFGKGVEISITKAISLYTKSCDLECGFGCLKLGLLHKTGTHVAQSSSKAKEFFSKACSLKDSENGCAQLGELYLKGDGVTRSSTKAVELFSKSCQLGDPMGCLNLGFQYELGDGVKQSFKQAIQLYSKACEGKNGEGCLFLGKLYESGRGVKKATASAVGFYAKGCDNLSGAACAELAELYTRGYGVSSSKNLNKAYLQAAEASSYACKLGDGKGCWLLGSLHESGLGVKIDLPTATELYTKACDLNNTRGCKALSELHRRGKGVSVSFEKALEFILKACSLGDQESCEVKDIISTPNKLLNYANSASESCKGGNADACYSLAFILAGQKNSESLGQSQTLLAKGCSLGHKDSCAARDLATKPQFRKTE